mgnify:CR=1 FL=1|tara:strand:+ start:626 stop:934 length:309 start_codon:yes stop_codon:yes gene_type:complete
MKSQVIRAQYWMTDMKEEVACTIRGGLWLASYEHKHGIDYSLHKTFEGAKQWHNSIVLDYKDEYVDTGDKFESFSTEELAESWEEVTGFTEFLNIIELPLAE